MLLALMPLMGLADTESVDGVEWTYNVTGGQAQIGPQLAIPKTTAGAIVVPATLGGKPVTGIGQGAFGGCSALTSVTLLEGVTSIGFNAFSDCGALQAVTIPSSVTDVGHWAFRRCPSLKTVHVSNDGDLSAVKAKLAASDSDPSWIAAVDGFAFDHVNTYVMFFDAGEGSGTMKSCSWEFGRVYNLPECTLTPPQGKSAFAGWACTNERRYDDGMLVFSLAGSGRSVTMTALWQ